MAASSRSQVRRSPHRPAWLDPLGRLLIGLVFVHAVVGKLMDVPAATAVIANRGLPMAPLLLGAAMLLMAAGSVLVIGGFRTRLGALLLLAFLVPTTLLFHGEVGDPQQRIQLLKNLAIVGGLLLVLDRSPAS
ncbi:MULTISPECIES: DoxX family membrane protein [Aphanothece]|uniref:DoxX family membrane protein n=1 Tax=Aphanothece TaxID=1121 RepID=UPI0039852CCC